MCDRSTIATEWDLMEKFNELIANLILFDVPLTGRKYTWSSKQPQSTLSKIDRVLLSHEWLCQFPVISLDPGAMMVSDHVPLLLQCRRHAPTKPPLRIEKYWLRYSEFDSLAATHWKDPTAVNGDPIRTYANKLQNMQRHLKIWHRARFSQMDMQRENCHRLITFFDRLEELRTLTDFEWFIRIKTRERVYEISQNQEEHWHQRARCKWL
jgi:hypothetical protein